MTLPTGLPPQWYQVWDRVKILTKYFTIFAGFYLVLQGVAFRAELLGSPRKEELRVTYPDTRKRTSGPEGCKVTIGRALV